MKSTLPTPEPEGAIPASRLGKSLEWLDKKEGVPPWVALSIRATVWMLLVESFRAWEEERLVQGDYPNERSAHRVVLTRLIANGETLEYVAKREGLSEFASGFTLQDLEATLASLRVTLSGEHGPANPPGRRELIEHLLNGS